MAKDKSKHLISYKKLGENIRAIREANGLSQEKLGFLISSARNYVGCVERAEKAPSLVVIFDIAKALNCKVEELFKGI